MGGGGGPGVGPKDLERLQELAKKIFEAARETSAKNVFISFAAEDLAEVNLLRGQAKNENSQLEFRDWSLREPFDSTRADYIRQGIRERIRSSSVVLVYVSEHTAKSKWVDWEIREGVRLGKGVCAVYKGEAPPASLPSAIKEFGVTLVQWKHGELAAAIERSSERRQG